MKELVGIIAAASALIAWPVMAQNYEGKWSGQFQVASGTPPNCTAKGPIAVSVTGLTVNVEVSQQGAAMQMSGGLRSDGSWETFVRLADGTFTGFTGQFDGRTFSGNYTGGTGCIGTFTGSKS